MSSFRTAFDLMTYKKSRPVTLLRRGSPDVTVAIRVSPTNYQRNLAGPGESVFEGREWIITKTALDASGFGDQLKRNDRLIDVELKEMTIKEVIEMYDLHADIVGFRVRTD